MNAITDYVDVVRVEIGGGITNTQLRIKKTPPPLLQAAIDAMNQFSNFGNAGIGGYTPEQMLNGIINGFNNGIASIRRTFASQDQAWVDDYIFKQSGGLEGKLQPPVTIPAFSAPVVEIAEDEDYDDNDDVPRESSVTTASGAINTQITSSKQIGSVVQVATTPSKADVIVTGVSGQGDVALIDTDEYTSVFEPDPTHRKVGYDGQGNTVYQLVDEAGNIIQWSVSPNGDSRTPINGTIRQVTGPNSQTSLVVRTVTDDTIKDTSVAGGNGGTDRSQSAGRFDPTHIFVGQDQFGNDVYQLTDEAGNLVEWAVPHGHDSREAIQISIRYVTAAMPSQVVKGVAKQLPGTLPPTTGIFDKVDIPKILGAVALAVLTR